MARVMARMLVRVKLRVGAKGLRGLTGLGALGWQGLVLRLARLRAMVSYTGQIG